MYYEIVKIVTWMDLLQSGLSKISLIWCLPLSLISKIVPYWLAKCAKAAALLKSSNIHIYLGLIAMNLFYAYRTFLAWRTEDLE